MSTAGVLRAARNEVMPQIPILATYLLEEPTIIRGALRAAAEAQDYDPDKIRHRDWNKAERVTISGFLIDQQRDFSIVGSGAEARFRYPEEGLRDSENDSRFSQALNRILHHGATAIEKRYSGLNTENRWWPLALQRYNRLGRRAAWASIFTHDRVPAEGRDLSRALRTEALSTVVARYASFVISHSQPGEERIQMSHDFLRIPESRAGIAFRQFLQSAYRLSPAVDVHERDGRYIGRISKQSQGWAKHRPNKGSVAMGCPANTRGLPADTEAGGLPDKNLRYFLHASMNYYIDYHPHFVNLVPDYRIKHFSGQRARRDELAARLEALTSLWQK